MATVEQLMASHEAEKYHVILVRALRTGSPQLIQFVYKNIYPLYEFAILQAHEEVDEYLKMRLLQLVVN